MNIAITGGSGFIGRALADRLRGAGHGVTSISLRSAPQPEDFAGCEAVVNLTEEAAPASDFLGQVAVNWEREARAAEEFGVRVVTPRIGVVLGRGGGALARMLPP